MIWFRGVPSIPLHVCMYVQCVCMYVFHVAFDEKNWPFGAQYLEWTLEGNCRAAILAESISTVVQILHTKYIKYNV